MLVAGSDRLHEINKATPQRRLGCQRLVGRGLLLMQLPHSSGQTKLTYPYPLLPSPAPQRRLGYRRLVGRGVSRDAAGAFKAFKVAAGGGDAMALYNLGWVAVLQSVACSLELAVCGLPVAHTRERL